MKIYHPDSIERFIVGGVKVSAQQQRKAFEKVGVEYTTDFTLDYDIMHLNFLGPLALPLLFISKLLGKKTVVHAHSTGDNLEDTLAFSSIWGPIGKKYYQFIFRHSDQVIAVSDYSKELLEEREVGDVITLSNGVDNDVLDGYNEIEVPDEYSEEAFRVVNLAQVFELKGLDTFIEVGESMPDAEFTWFGPRHEKLNPKETIEKIDDTPENVSFPGFIDDKRIPFRIGDVYLFPSHEETQGISVLEAAYCEMPLVVRDIEAFEGWLKHRENCLKAETTDEFIEHVKTLRDDEELREKIAANAREMAEHHTLEKIGERLQKMYREVLSSD
ncbi:glycosyltransferase family 4 protein [Candidatus Nanosalina sp. VS9-1]|uniref:glycosyltransferase family 4 protein n=1 Tax=Candidatus Nanosalina sp. VS9-1 TaxID=3388566 RepID=UPI0039DFAAB7